MPADFRRATVDGRPKWVATREFTATIADDTYDEPNETFAVTLSLANETLPHLFIGDTDALVTIEDNDQVPVEITWAESSVTVTEGDGTATLTAQVTTKVDKMPEAGFTVALTAASTDNSAAVGEDYAQLNIRLTLRQGDFSPVDINGEQRFRATQDVTVTILDGDEDEDEEIFRVRLSYVDPTLPHLQGSSQTATIAITDNDFGKVTLSFVGTTFGVQEPLSPDTTRPVTITVQAVTEADRQPKDALSLQFTVETVNGTARAPDDYTPLTKTDTLSTFTANDFFPRDVNGELRYIATKDFTLDIKHDEAQEGIEDLRANLAYQGPPRPHLLISDNRATVNIADDQASVADVGVNVDPSPSQASRGDEITYEWSVFNVGPAASTGTSLVADLGRGVTVTSATYNLTGDPADNVNCARSGARVTCSLGALEINDMPTGSIVVQVAETASADLTVSIDVSNNKVDTDNTNNHQQATVGLIAPPEAITNLVANATATYIDLTWSVPADNGSKITSYVLERKSDLNGADEFGALADSPNAAARSYRDEGIEVGTEYTYRLRAVNEDGEAELSNEAAATPRIVATQGSSTGGGGGGGGFGGFGPAPIAPSFVDGFRTSRPLAVNARPGDSVGEPVAATHPNEDEAITYSLSGTDAASFTVDAETGQIRFSAALTLELGQSFTVNLTATDSAGTGAIIIVVIGVAEAAHHPYDANRNGVIERDEVIAAVRDYFSGIIAKDEVIVLIQRYFAG